MAITDSEPQVKSYWPWYLIGGIAVVLAPVLFFAFGARQQSGTPGKDKVTEDHLAQARQALHNEADLETCRSALADFNAYLAKSETQRPKPLSGRQRSELRDRYDLDGGELAELDADTFTQLDSHYLDMCFLLHDAATALDVEAVGPDGGKRRPTPLRQAEAAFGWAARQVRVDRADGAPLPPQFVLRRGSGSALERALVFLELLRHVGEDDEHLTGCLVYCPDRDGDRRLWACGVLVGDKPDVYLFDPRLGLPLPGPKGEGVATLANAGAEEVLDQLRPHGYDVTPEQAAKADLRYVCTLTALAPRTRVLQDDLLQSTPKVRLAVNGADDVERLTRAAAAQPTKPAVRAWKDGQASGAGVLRRSLPPEEGGTDDSKPLNRRERFVQNLVPWGAMPELFRNEQIFPPHVGLGLRVRMFFADPFLKIVMEPHRARDELLRGRYGKALRELVEARTLCRNAEDRLNQLAKEDNFMEEVGTWNEQAIAAYAEQQRAAGNPQKQGEANAKIEEIWKESRSVHYLLDGTRSWPLRLEVLFDLALCKHEQAAHLQLEAELSPQDAALADKAVDAWKEAVNVWQQYLDEYRAARANLVRLEQIARNAPRDRRLFVQTTALRSAVDAAALAGTAPGHVARMLGQAQWLSGDHSGARQSWRQEVPTYGMEKVGSLYLSRKTDR